MDSKNKCIKRVTQSTILVPLLAFLLVSAPSIVWAQSQNPFNVAIPQGLFLYNPSSGGGPQGQSTFGSGAEGFIPNSEESLPLKGGTRWYEQVAPSEPMEMSGQMGMREQMGRSGPLEHWNR